MMFTLALCMLSANALLVSAQKLLWPRETLTIPLTLTDDRKYLVGINMVHYNALLKTLENKRIGSGDPGLIVAQGSTWRPHAQASSAYSPGSPFRLASPDLPTRAVALVKEKKLEEKFGDFDDHLENVTIDWL
ncbi:hypothetical protein BDZ89DRAFT_1155880 [Hymenopellis radicata]|nr:hypothetical protein BDZ89DRAFT_1155880 [Hymenopellis radicata]